MHVCHVLTVESNYMMCMCLAGWFVIIALAIMCSSTSSLDFDFFFSPFPSLFLSLNILCVSFVTRTQTNANNLKSLRPIETIRLKWSWSACNYSTYILSSSFVLSLFSLNSLFPSIRCCCCCRRRFVDSVRCFDEMKLIRCIFFLLQNSNTYTDCYVACRAVHNAITNSVQKSCYILKRKWLLQYNILQFDAQLLVLLFISFLPLPYNIFTEEYCFMGKVLELKAYTILINVGLLVLSVYVCLALFPIPSCTYILYFIYLPHTV